MSAHDHTRTPGRGDMLIARPYLDENFFSHAVVLLLDTDRQGATMGLSLNVPTDLSMRDLIPAWQRGGDIPVYCGGPCDTDRLFVLHTIPDMAQGSLEIMPGLFVGGHIADIIRYIDSGGETAGRIRFFVGYAGWHRDQLAGEIAEGTWAVGHPSSADGLLSGMGIPFWRRRILSLGPRYRPWMVLPSEPELN